MHALCSLRKLPRALKHSPWHRLQHSLCRLDHELQQAHGIPGKQLQLCWENHQWKIKRFIFYRDFLAHSRDLDSFHCPARSHRLSYNCWAGLWGTAGPQQGMPRLSLYPGRIHGNGEMRAQCHGEDCLCQPSVITGM